MKLFIIVIRDAKRRESPGAPAQGDPLHPKHQREDQAQRYNSPNADVKYALFNLFEAFGQVLQIVCKRSDRMRGQAFVVFREVGEATAAKNNLSGYPIFGKPMVDVALTLENPVRSQAQ
jgi:RNA recognition motif-containing protein